MRSCCPRGKPSETWLGIYIRYERHLADNQIKLKRRTYEVVSEGHSYVEKFASNCALSVFFGVPEEKNKTVIHLSGN